MDKESVSDSFRITLVGVAYLILAILYAIFLLLREIIMFPQTVRTVYQNRMRQSGHPVGSLDSWRKFENVD